MKRTAAALLAVLLSTPLFASETQRYLVGTTRAFRFESKHIARTLPSLEALNVQAFRTFKGFAANLTPEEAAELRADANVRYVEPVVERHALSLDRNLTGQTLTYGVSLVNAPKVWLAARLAPINVVVIDSGIDFNHPDLKDAYAGGINIVEPGSDPLDDNEHGTHVSGIIGAADNQIGVVGVDPFVKIWAAKVLDNNGNGTNANV